MAETLIRGSSIRAAVDSATDLDVTEEQLQRGRYFEATCAAGRVVGEFVYVSAIGAGLPTVALCDPHDVAKMPAIGCIQAKITATSAIVATVGEVTLSGLSAGAYYIGAAGTAVITAPPAAPSGGVTIAQRAGDALSATRLRLDLHVEGVSTLDHRTLRQLIHFIDEGPAEGFATGAFCEVTNPGLFPTAVTWYTDVSKAIKIVELAVTWSGTVQTVRAWTVYNAAGTALATVTDTITYTSTIFETSRTRSIVIL